jgi:hypothetical protein
MPRIEGGKQHAKQYIYQTFVELSTTLEAIRCAATHCFAALYGTRRFFTAFTMALHLYLS